MEYIYYSYAMNRNHLALFHAVAQAGGISRGAERLRVSQPAVSKQIKELEDSLGVRLLERLPERQPAHGWGKDSGAICPAHGCAGRRSGAGH